MDWQPIETAPDDGPYLLHYVDMTGTKGYWVSGGRRETGGFRGDQLRPPPTHWAPIFPPPAQLVPNSGSRIVPQLPRRLPIAQR